MSRARDLFLSKYPTETPEVIKSNGRLEIIGNHTDHNHGLCLVAGASMGIECAFIKTNDGKVRLSSVGYPDIVVDLDDLEKKDREIGKSSGLVRGVLFRLKQLGYKIGSFKGAMDSDIFPGAGVSSSACYESLIVAVVNHLFNEDKISPLTMAEVGQFSEREYFGKPCGLLDQIGTSFGGIDYLDFKDLSSPVVYPMKWPFDLKIVLVNSGGNHAKLTNLYASIPDDMFKIAAYFNKANLREVGEETFYNNLDKLNKDSSISKLAISRAEHFFEENKRVRLAKEAVEKADQDAFLRLIKQTQESSKNKLKNTQVPDQYEGSPQKAVDVANSFLTHGAVRIMGGGFAGSIICFVYPEDLEEFKKKMGEVYGDNNVVPVSIPEGGPKLI